MEMWVDYVLLMRHVCDVRDTGSELDSSADLDCRRLANASVRGASGARPRNHCGPAGGVCPETADAASRCSPSLSPSSPSLSSIAATSSRQTECAVFLPLGVVPAVVELPRTVVACQVLGLKS